MSPNILSEESNTSILENTTDNNTGGQSLETAISTESDDNSNGTDDVKNITESVKTPSEQKNTPQTTTTENKTITTQDKPLAAGEPVTYSLAAIKDAASRTYNWIVKNKRLPNYVTINSNKIDMSDFLYLLSKATTSINSGSKSNIEYLSLKDATIASGKYLSGSQIKKASYITIANSLNKYMETNKVAPSTSTTYLGKIKFQDLIYSFSSILSFQKTKNRMPNYVSVWSYRTAKTTSIYNLKPVTTTAAGSSGSTAAAGGENSSTDSSSISVLAKSITSKYSTTYNRAVAAYNWVRDNIDYEFYYNTKKGAAKTLSSRGGNCCDQAQLLAALYKALGIDYKFYHGSAKFTSGTTYGHVWLKVNVNGKWYNADTTSSRNSFGTIKNWDTSSLVLKGTYNVLPF